MPPHTEVNPHLGLGVQRKNGNGLIPAQMPGELGWVRNSAMGEQEPSGGEQWPHGSNTKNSKFHNTAAQRGE